jgi:hypothetical protein
MLCKGEMRNANRSSVGNLKGRSHLKDLDVDEKMVLNKLLVDASLGWINLIQDRPQWRAPYVLFEA